MTIEELKAIYEQATAAYKAATEAAEPYVKAKDTASRAEKEAELALLRAEGRGRSANAAWIEAWLEGRHEDCQRIVASEEFRRECSQAWAASAPQACSVIPTSDNHGTSHAWCMTHGHLARNCEAERAAPQTEAAP